MIAVKGAIVLLCACIAAGAMRRRSASLRHAVLAAGFGMASLLPLLERTAPGWGTAVTIDLPLARDVWYAGAGISLLTVVAGLARMAWIRASARPVAAHVQAIADDAALECGIRRSVTMLETERAVVPMTWGLLRPTILFPAVAATWDEHCVRAVCRHELAHVRRGDWAVQLIAAVLARVFWFNPVVWLAARWLRIESERACDDAVLNLGVDGPEYAADLLHVTRTLRSRDALLRLAPSAGGGGFERRIVAALDPAIERTPLSTAACIIVTALLAVAAVPVAGFGEPTLSHTPPLLAVQRDVLRRFGGEERRFSIVAGDISFWKNRIEGRVELQARLNVDGSVSAVQIVEPAHPDLARAAETIVRHWRREPATVRGVAVEVPIRMTVDFRR